jgi:hypothetical protein
MVEVWSALVGSANSTLAKFFVYLCRCIETRFPIVQTGNRRELPHYTSTAGMTIFDRKVRGAAP